MSLDQMLAHLDAWDRTSNRRVSQRRVYRTARDIERRLVADRRAALGEVEHLRRRESDFASLDAELPPAKKGVDHPVEKRGTVEREAPLPLAREGKPVEEETTKPAKRKRRQREESPKSPKPEKPLQSAKPPKSAKPLKSAKPRTRRRKDNDDEVNPNP
jgi:hypothetical protein